ncbi:MAG TPA: NADH-quinone oxidoreductase subunit L [Actinomycetota bacterium]|nr:NADH-quinone oxidoreductase subunit L [Actinomycetota bacterium]
MIPGPDFLGLAGTIILTTLSTAVFLLFFGSRLNRWSTLAQRIPGWVGWLAAISVGRAFFEAIVLLVRLLERPEEHRSIAVHAFDWLSVGGFKVGFDFLIDPLSVTMVLVITGVGLLIHIYSIGYMKGDPRFSRFFAYLNLFTASMLLLVLADNLLLLYVGWEAVGLCSFLLIGFWFEKPSASNAAKKAFIVNRIGDFAFLLGILLIAGTVGNLTLGQVNAQAGAMAAGTATTICLLLFAGATGKSAQIPLYIWLPDAMEGPTPVSALIHAATMVTAGVYMVARMSPLFEASGGIALTVVGYIGALTALWAALMAAAEYDIKRVLAYSTISQLGYMFLAHGVGGYSAGMFHLVTHAFFKALMFLGAGAVMHGLGGETDMREMGGLRKVMPITGWTFMMGWLAICGVIPFAGFFSKDAILATAWAQGEYVLWAIGIATAFLTAFYMSRLYFRVFEGRVKVPEGVHAHDVPWTMAVALIPLAGLALVGGFLNLPGSLTLEHFLEPVVGESTVPHGLTPWLLAGGALLVAALGIAVAGSLYLSRSGNVRRRTLVHRLGPVAVAARNKFYVDEIYGYGIVLPAKRAAAFAADVFDPKVIDGAVTGIGRLVGRTSEAIRGMQSGYVRSYAATFLIGVVIITSVLLARVGT